MTSSNTALSANIQVITFGQAPAWGKGFYYCLSLTGSLQNFYTLYRMGDDGTPKLAAAGATMDSGYRGNMGTTWESALAAVQEYFGETAKIQIVLLRDEPRPIVRGEVVKFSKKYPGYTVEEIHAVDPNYFRWMVKEIKDGGTLERCAQWLKDKVTTIDRECRAKFIEDRRATSKSEYVGTLKTRMALTIICTGYRVFKADPHKGQTEDSYMFNFVQGDNVLSAYGEKGEFEKGSTYTVKATPVDHREVAGAKVTRINRIAVSSVEAAPVAEVVETVVEVAVVGEATVAESVVELAVFENTLPVTVAVSECEAIGSILFVTTEHGDAFYWQGIMPSNISEMYSKPCACELCSVVVREAVCITPDGGLSEGIVCLECADGAREWDVDTERNAATEIVTRNIARFGQSYLDRFKTIRS